MKSIQEIFTGGFSQAKNAVIQKLRPDEHNVGALENGYTEHWPKLPETFDMLVLAVGDSYSTVRTLWAGLIQDVVPSTGDSKKVRIYVDRFEKLGQHDRSVVPDAVFYANGGGGGSRVKITSLKRIQHRSTAIEKRLNPGAGLIPEGAMEQRLLWVRKNHNRFRDPVWRHWEGRCAVTNADCDGLLIASHIHPWARSTPKEQTDVNNGLLLSVPLDKLFDRGLISFSANGKMLVKPGLTERTREVFGINKPKMQISRLKKLTKEMLTYLERHRAFHGFERR